MDNYLSTVKYYQTLRLCYILSSSQPYGRMVVAEGIQMLYVEIFDFFGLIRRILVAGMWRHSKTGCRSRKIKKMIDPSDEIYLEVVHERLGPVTPRSKRRGNANGGTLRSTSEFV